MDIARTAGPTSVAAIDRVAPSPSTTELPARKVVAPIAADSAPSAADTATSRPVSTGDGPGFATEHRVVVDPQTSQLVSQTIDTSTHEVVGQLPDRTLLGLRAYLDGLVRQQEEAARSDGLTRHVLPALVA